MAVLSLKELAAPNLCPHCKKRHLWTRDEIELQICNPCADEQYEHYRERMEFEHYHPGETE